MSRTLSAAHRHCRWAALALVPVLVAGCGSGDSESTPVQPAAAPAAAAAPADEEVAGVERPAVPPAPSGDRARPVRVQLSRLGIDAAMDPLRLDAARVLVPPQYGRAGWYEAGPEPGELGRAVVAGHVDSKTGPDVFAALHRARKGDVIVVRLADGSTVRFAVQSIETHAQDDFPTSRVYGGPKKRAEIRLITCTGPYDRARGRYLENLIVFGTLTR